MRFNTSGSLFRHDAQWNGGHLAGLQGGFPTASLTCSPMSDHLARGPRLGPLSDHRYRTWPMFVAMLLSLLALAMTHAELRQHQVKDRDAAFARQAHRLHERLSERIHAYDEILKGAAGLHAAFTRMSRADWRTYVSALQLDEDHFGMQGLGFALRLKEGDLARHVASVRAEGFPAYEVMPPGARPEMGLIYYIEPFHGRNMLAFGFDMYSEPVRREAMQRARDSGDIAYSGRVRLIQETDVDVQAGVLAYMPVYQGGMHPATKEQRQRLLEGWVYATFRMADLLNAVFQQDLQRVHVRVVDVGPTGQDKPALLFDSHVERPEAAEEAPGDTEVSFILPMHGRQWQLSYRPMPGNWPLPAQGAYLASLLVVAIGGVLFCALVWSLANTRLRAQTMALELSDAVAESEERFRLMVESVRDYAVLMLDPQGVIRSWNAGARRIKGWEAEEIIGQHFSRFYTPEDIAQNVPEHALATALVSGQFRGEGLRVRKDGSTFRASVLITAMRDADGQIKGFTKVTRDITEHHQQEERLRLAATVFRSTQEGVAITDAQARVLAVNPAFERITEYKEADVVGLNLRLLASGRHDREFFRAFWLELIETGFWQGEIWNRRRGGEVHPGWLAVSAVRDDQQQIVNFVSVYTDITRIPHAQTQIDRLAHHDALTDLPNRVLLHTRLNHTLERAQRAGSLCAVLFLDLDRFKPVNDQMGHEAGDELLKGVAKRLRLHLRENDTVARIGGDEFVVVLEDLASPEGAEVVARAIIERMQRPFVLPGDREAHIGCSVGIAMFPKDGEDGETLLRHADAALYAAKGAGRGTFRFFVAQEAGDSDGLRG